MNRSLAALSLCAFGSLFLLGGCQKPADQQSATDANSSAPSSDSSTPKADASKAEAPRPRPIVVPADTVINVVLDEPVGSKISSPGQNFAASVSQPVEVGGRIAIPKGARATGVVKNAKPAGRFKGGASLELTLDSIEINGTNYEVHTTAPVETSKGKGKRTAAMVGGGAGGGAVIGGLAGGGKGALIGGVMGGSPGPGRRGHSGPR